MSSASRERTALHHLPQHHAVITSHARCFCLCFFSFVLVFSPEQCCSVHWCVTEEGLKRTLLLLLLWGRDYGAIVSRLCRRRTLTPPGGRGCLFLQFDMCLKEAAAGVPLYPHVWTCGACIVYLPLYAHRAGWGCIARCTNLSIYDSFLDPPGIGETAWRAWAPVPIIFLSFWLFLPPCLFVPSFPDFLSLSTPPPFRLHCRR